MKYSLFLKNNFKKRKFNVNLQYNKCYVLKQKVSLKVFHEFVLRKLP